MRIQHRITPLWMVFASMIVILFNITVPLTVLAETGLDFPGSGSGTVRFKFENPHLNGLPIYGPSGQGVTYIWKYYPRQQAGYYTTFFWGNDDGEGDLSTFLWTPTGGADSYYGFHPYPNPPPNGTAHNWEVSVEQMDYQNGVVEYGQWFTQAARVWADGSGKHHIFYWNLPNTNSGNIVSRTSPTSWGNQNPPSPALTWGDAPWAPGNEVCDGIIRAIAIYNTALSVSDMLDEASSPLSTAAGQASIWYLNTNPTPNDISDKSGNGHHPVWVGSKRPGLYTDGLVQYTLITQIEGSGTIALDPVGGTYAENTTVTLTATADEGWVFNGWSNDLDGSSNPATVLMDSNKIVTAHFADSVDTTPPEAPKNFRFVN